MKREGDIFMCFNACSLLSCCFCFVRFPRSKKQNLLFVFFFLLNVIASDSFFLLARAFVRAFIKNANTSASTSREP